MLAGRVVVVIDGIAKIDFRPVMTASLFLEAILYFVAWYVNRIIPFVRSPSACNGRIITCGRPCGGSRIHRRPSGFVVRKSPPAPAPADVLMDGKAAHIDACVGKRQPPHIGGMELDVIGHAFALGLAQRCPLAVAGLVAS